MWVEAQKLLKVCFPNTTLHMKPGIPLCLPENHALNLLAKAKGKVRWIPQAKLLTIGEKLSAGEKIYWQSCEKRKGPGTILLVDDQYDGTWLLVKSRSRLNWVSASLVVHDLEKGNLFGKEVTLMPTVPMGKRIEELEDELREMRDRIEEVLGDDDEEDD